MKKWMIACCCILVAAVVAIVFIVNNSNNRIDTLNKDLQGIQTENNSLKEKSEQDDKTIEDLNLQVGELTSEKERLTAENVKLSETIDGMSKNLSSSQQKLQGVMYILTDGEQGSIEGYLSPFMKIYQDVSMDSPYFVSIAYAEENQLMAAESEEVFGAQTPLTLGETAESLFRLQGREGTRAEAVAALLQAEKALTGTAEEPAAEPEATEEPTEEQTAEPEAAEDENTILTRERLLALCGAWCQEAGKEMPGIVLPESDAAEAVRGDLAIVLRALAE